MQVEDYFDFTDYEKYGEIRIEGHRVYMHNVLFEYLKNGRTTPQAILERFESLEMPEVLACLLYYHTHQAEMDKMLADHLAWSRQVREQQRLDHPELHERMARARAEREAAAAR
jgi:uncharacterized protein (DUF433 family)